MTYHRRSMWEPGFQLWVFPCSKRTYLALFACALLIVNLLVPSGPPLAPGHRLAAASSLLGVMRRRPPCRPRCREPDFVRWGSIGRFWPLWDKSTKNTREHFIIHLYILATMLLRCKGTYTLLHGQSRN
jgi:hypothetical protein